MSDVIDIFTKKPVKDSEGKTFFDRYKKCLAQVALHGECHCDLCEDKKIMASRLHDITMYLCMDYKDKTGEQLYYPDALEIVLIAAELLKSEINK